MTHSRSIGFVAGAASILAVGCAASESPNAETGAAAVSETSETFQTDYSVARFCSVTAYSSAVEATKFAVGDFVVAGASGTTAAAFPLSKIVMRDDEGKPTEVRFFLYLRHDATSHSQLLTPYSPMPFAEQTATSLTFRTPADVSTTDVSTMKISLPKDDDVLTIEFSETVHGKPGRDITLACTIDPKG